MSDRNRQPEASALVLHPPAPLVAGDPDPGLFGRVLSPLFEQVAVEVEAAERLRRAYADGIVVHVMRARRVLDPVYLLFLLERLRLAPPRWMHDHYATVRLPVVEALVQTVQAGEPALLFLKRPRTLTSPISTYAENHVDALLELAAKSDRPILLVPESLLWRTRAGGVRRTVIDAIFGDRETPGRIRELGGFLLNRRDARFHVGAPIDLRAFLERERGRPSFVIAKKVRWALLHHLAREEAIRTGPQRRPERRTRQMVLNDREVQRAIQERQDAGEDAAQVKARAERLFGEIAADPRYGWIRVLDAVIDYVWSNIYDGIHVDEEGLEKVRSAARRGPVVLVPSHKSHVDYLVLSQVFFRRGMMPPLIAAGENLSFWPLGTIFRRGGAFFIRRSFGGDRLYAAVVHAYVRRLLKEGHAVEFFIEGGRSRTGKLLPPKMGLLTMCVAPVLEGAIEDVSFVPVSIGYEKIIEARSYARELEGGAKQKEDVAALIGTSRVLRSKYGRVYVDFDDPISLRAFAAARGVPIASRLEATEAAQVAQGGRRSLVGQLSHRIVYGINRATRVTPTGIAALVLLAQTRRGMGERELFHRAQRLIDLLIDSGARMSGSLAPPTRSVAIREALGRLAADGHVLMLPAPDGETIYRIEEAGRRALDWYKNNTLHFLAPYSIVTLALAAALRAGGATEISEDRLREAARRLSQILKLELSYRVDTEPTENFRASAAYLDARHVIERRASEPAFTIPESSRDFAIELGSLLAVFLEGYRLAAESLATLDGGPQPERALLKEALARGARQILEGRMLRAEAASQTTLQNALSLFVDLGVLSREQGSIAWAQPDGKPRGSALIKELDALLAPVA